MTRLDQLSQPRKQSVLVAVDITSGGGGAGPVRPPRHRSSGQLSRAAGHRSVGNLLAAVGPAPPPRRHAVKTSPGQTGQYPSGSGRYLDIGCTVSVNSSQILYIEFFLYRVQIIFGVQKANSSLVKYYLKSQHKIFMKLINVYFINDSRPLIGEGTRWGTSYQHI